MGYRNHWNQSMDYSGHVMISMQDQNQRLLMHMEKLMYEAFEKDGSLDTLDWLLIGQYFAKTMDEELAF